LDLILFLLVIQDKVSILQVVPIRVCFGELAHNRQTKSVKGHSVEDYIRSIGKMSLAIGTFDPGSTKIGQMEFRVTRMWTEYNKRDTPPNQVKPVLISVLWHIMVIALSGDNAIMQCTVIMIVLAVFHLLLPYKYIDSAYETAPFTLADTRLFIENTSIKLLTAPDGEILFVIFYTLTFTTHKKIAKTKLLG